MSSASLFDDSDQRSDQIRSSAGWTYCVADREAGRLKVGKADGVTPEGRVRSVETAAGGYVDWIGVLPLARLRERHFHKTLEKAGFPRLAGGSEWYSLTPQVEEFARLYIEHHGGHLGRPVFESGDASTYAAPIDDTEPVFYVAPTLPGMPYRRRRSRQLRATLDGRAIPTTSETGTVDYYTPPQYVESARRVMGGIDLDPASCEEANKVVRARVFYTESDDGLKQEWTGNVFMNPPWSGQAEPFIRALLQHYRAGLVRQAVVLVSASYVDRRYMRTMMESFPLCLTDHRIKYYGNGKNGTGGDMFFYLGPARQRFVDEFSQHGPVFMRLTSSTEHCEAK